MTLENLETHGVCHPLRWLPMLAVLFCGPLGCNRWPASSDTASSRVEQESESQPAMPPVPEPSQESTIAQIDRLIRVGDLDEAERLVQAMLIRSPEDSRALMFRAQIDAARGRIEQAVDELDALASRSSDKGKLMQTQAAALLAQAGRWSQAIPRLDAFVKAYPDDDEARHQLVEWLNWRGFRFDANEQVRQLCRRNQATVDELRGLIAPAKSHTGFAEKPNIDNRQEIERYGAMNIARGLFSAGDVQDAIRVMNQSEWIQERHPAAVAFYGQLLLEAQQYEDFEVWLGRVEPECQRYPAYWIAMGGWAMRQRAHASAIRMFAEAIRREPGDLNANDRMTQALAAAGHVDTSERFRERGVEIDQLVQEATNLMNGSVAPLPAMSNISRLLRRIGRPAESLAWTRIALEKMGSPPDAMQQLAAAAALLDDAEFNRSAQASVLCGLDWDEFPLDVESISRTGRGVPSVPFASNSGFASPRPPSYVNVARHVGIDFRYANATEPKQREFQIFQQIGGGVACFDYDLDGKVDFYIAQASGDPPNGQGTSPNVLSRNLGDRFLGVTLQAGCDDRGYSGGVTSGDWNQDGFTDLVVANLQRNTLFINQGDGTFHAQAGDAVWDAAIYSASVAMGDVNGDHLPDIVEVNYLDDPRIFDPLDRLPDGTLASYPAPNLFQAAPDRLFVSQGDGTFFGRTLGDPEQPPRAPGLGVVVTDIDGQPGNEIFIANDHWENHLWELDSVPGSEPTWKNTAAARGIAFGSSGTPLGCMGIAVADFDDNGRIDFHVTNFENQWSNHYLQHDGGFFEDFVVAVGLSQPTHKMVGFGAQAIDYDNNSWIDLVIGNGHVEDFTAQGRSKFEMPTQVFHLQGSRFEQVQVAGDDAYWDAGHLTRALAYCDWNRDGRVDFVTTDLTQPFALLENRTKTPYHWLQLQLVGTQSERDAIGARITTTSGARSTNRVIQSGDGYMCKNESIIFIGIGEQDSVDRVEVHWPTGRRQLFRDLEPDRRWLIIEGQEAAFDFDSR